MKKIKFLFLLLLPMLLSSMRVRGEDVSIGLTLSDTDMTVGTVADIPIVAVGSFAGAEVLSYTLQFRWDARYLQIETVVTEGCIAAAFGAPTVNIQPGMLTLSAAGTVPLTGTGTFLKLRVRALNTGWIRLEKTNDGMNMWNENSPRMVQSIGYIRINSAQSFGVWSGTTLMAKGERTQFTAGSNAVPIGWTVGDPAVASIDSTGWLTALGTGKTIVVATDTNGVRGVSNELEVRAARISLPVSMTQWPGDTIDVPIWVSSLTGMNILSGQVRLGYNQAVLEPIDVLQAGTLLEHAYLEMKTGTGQLTLVFAGTEPLPGLDTLCLVRFRVKPNPNGGTNVDILNALLNEQVQVATTNGYFYIRQPEYRYVYPNEASLLVGETARFRVEGRGIPPYTWKVSNPALAEVDPSGILTVKHSGSVVLTATDSVGISVSTQPLTLRDTRIQIPDTAICYYSGMLRYPVRMDALPRFEAINSLQGALQYDTFYVALDRVELSERIPSDWSLATNIEPDEIRFAASGSSALSQTGNLVYFWFRLKSNFNTGAWSNIRLNNWIFNEGLPTVLLDNQGSIQGQHKHQGYASISCDNPHWTCLGDTIRFRSEIWNAAPVKYQWLRNRVPVHGANAPEWFTTVLNHLDTVSCTIISLDPCIEDSVLETSSMTVYVKLPPAKPDSLTGDPVIYKGESRSYEVHFTENDVQYLWHFPKGFTPEFWGPILHLTATDSAQSGYVSVALWNNCGVSDSLRFYVNVRTKPVIPEGIEIFGPKTVCAGERNLVYRIPPIAHVESYYWEMPDGFTGYSSADSILVQVADTAQDGYLKVNYVFERDTVYLAGLDVEVKHRPASLGAIWGPETPFNMDTLMYTVQWNPDVEFFEWIVPDGLSGPMTTSNWIRLAPQTNTFNGWLAVVGHGRCGVSDTSKLHIAFHQDTIVVKPAIVGPEWVCSGEDSLVYRLINCLGRYALNWELPAGMTGFSNTDSILVHVGTQAVSDSLRVYVQLPVGKKLLASMYVTVSTKPDKLGPISGPTLIKQPTDSVTYLVPQVPNVHFYLWQLPHGLYGWSETNLITVKVADSSFVGTIYVRGFNWCGPGVADSLTVTVTKTVGLDELGSADVLLYPNPFTDYLTIRTGLNAKQPDRLEIYDATGRLLNLKSLDTGNRRTLDFTGRSPGIYLLKLTYSDGYRLYKVLKN